MSVDVEVTCSNNCVVNTNWNILKMDIFSLEDDDYGSYLLLKVIKEKHHKIMITVQFLEIPWTSVCRW